MSPPSSRTTAPTWPEASRLSTLPPRYGSIEMWPWTSLVPTTAMVTRSGAAAASPAAPGGAPVPAPGAGSTAGPAAPEQPTTSERARSRSARTTARLYAGARSAARRRRRDRQPAERGDPVGVLADPEGEVGGVGQRLAPARVDLHPAAAQVHLGPGVPAEPLDLVPHVDQAGHLARRDAGGAGERDEQQRMLSAVAGAAGQHLGGGRQVGRQILGDVLVDPADQALDLGRPVALLADDLAGEGG